MSAADSLAKLRQCDRPAAPIDESPGHGLLWLLIDTRGRVVLDSVRVLRAEQISAAGLRSAALRQLPTCRFVPGTSGGRAATRPVIAAVAFQAGRLTLQLSPEGQAEPENLAALPLDSSAVVADSIYPGESAELDERPLKTSCQLVARDEVTTRTRVDGQVPSGPPMTGSLLPPPHGAVELAYVVDRAGRVVERSVTVLRTTAPELVDLARGRLKACRFAPARLGGVAVGSAVRGQETF